MLRWLDILLGVSIGLIIGYFRWHKQSPAKSRYKLVGGAFLKTYPETRPPDTIPFVKGKLVDAEGGELPADQQPGLTYTFSSDKENIVSIQDNGNDTITVTYNSMVKLPDNSYDIATIKAESNEITGPDGTPFKDVITEQVQLVPGAAAGIQGGSFNLPDA